MVRDNIFSLSIKQILSKYENNATNKCELAVTRRRHLQSRERGMRERARSKNMRISCRSLRLHLSSDTVALHLEPVHLGASHGQLTAERLEGGLAHGGVVLLDGSLVRGLLLADHSQHLASRANCVCRHVDFDGRGLVREELHVAVLVVVHLALNGSLHLLCSILSIAHGHHPLGAPATIDVVGRCELVAFDAQSDHSVPREHAANAPRGEVLVDVRIQFLLEGGSPRLELRLDGRRLRDVHCLATEVVELERLSRLIIDEAAVADVVVVSDERLLLHSLQLHGNKLLLVVLGEDGRASLAQQRVVLEQHADVIKDLIELAGRRVQQEVGGDAHFLTVGDSSLAAGHVKFE
ncbi:hypothetical protein PMAYCL1PPCAC_19928, partial [Pristionchus mayeri]